MELLCSEVIVLAILLSIKSPAASAVFLITLFEVDNHDQELFACIYRLSLHLYFYQYFCSYFQQKIKICNFLQIN